MPIPLRYSVRNVFRRKMRTILTVLAVALVVGVSTFMAAYVRGVLNAARNSGSPDNIVVMDRRAASQVFSKISQRDLALLKSLPQLRRDASGEALISAEAVHQSRVSVGEYKDRPGTIRGVSARVFDVNGLLTLKEGTRPTTGRNIVVGELAFAALGVPAEALAPGAEVQIENETWKVVGRFAAGGTALDSEILADIADVMAVYQRESYSTALLKATSPADAAVLVGALNNRNDIQVKAMPEREYYAGLAEGYERIIFLAAGMAVIAAIGGLVSGMNTMYAAVLGRIREIGTLKVLGYRSRAVVVSFVAESLAMALVGALPGLWVASLADGLSTKFATGALRVVVDEWALGIGLAVAVVIGVVGALPPALKGVRLGITNALKYHG
ncbi:MAG: ABC transporter permease [Planctomycetes bacterium]|nr:ABC transporter permease [Planctomycetota bacterium]